MIYYALRTDYSTDPELKKKYQAWLKDEMTQLVIGTLNGLSRAYNHPSGGTEPTAVAYALGCIVGQQRLLDEMQSLDAPIARRNLEEEFRTDPTKA